MKNTPNIITCLNLFAGCLACVMALAYQNYYGAFLFVVLASVFDFLDGFSARLLKTFSPIGKELDSLADVVSFGAAPGFIVYSYLSGYTDVAGLPFLALLLPVFSALRLAKFNVDARQKTSFLGLPVPASGLFWAALIPSVHRVAVYFPIRSVLAAIAVGIILFCLLMVSELPVFSLKFDGWTWGKNRWRWLIIGIGIILTGLLQGLGICLTIICYILLSVVLTRRSAR
jgi:CDP-diacylglycerol--serine O-phosphatidyltransferase